MDRPNSIDRATTSENSVEVKRAKAPVSRALWIASYPKSGNTWVRAFLNNLMRELHGEAEGAQSINALSDWTSGESFGLRFEARLGKPIGEAGPAEIAALRAPVQADLLQEATDRQRRPGPIFVKTHNAVANVEGFPTINFDATLAAVYLVRNPLDVAVSYARHSGLDVDRIIDFMANPLAKSHGRGIRVYEFMGSWSFHVASWMSVPNRPVLILRYEDLLAAPEKSFARLAAFLRLKPEARQLRRAIEHSAFAELARQERLHGFAERSEKAEIFFRVGRAGQWKEALSKCQIRAVIDSHGPMMMRCGYLTESCGG